MLLLTTLLLSHHLFTTTTTTTTSAYVIITNKKSPLTTLRGHDHHQQTTTTTTSSTTVVPLSRRDWFTHTATAIITGSGTASLLNPHEDATAATTTAQESPAVSSSSSSSSSVLCDPAISTFQRPRDNRIIHLLGTAHISASSAQVAGQLVRETKPKGVFVELDAKRVRRAFEQQGGGKYEVTAVPVDGPMNNSEMDRPTAATGSSTTTASTTTARTNDQNNMPESSSPPSPSKKSGNNNNNNGWKNPFRAAGSFLVGNSIKTMYSKLESQGFSAGEEFSMAAREGLAYGATIILGDRDVDVTMDHLATAFSKTDLRKLLTADEEFERKMTQLLPDDAAAALMDKKKSSSTSSSSSSLDLDAQQLAIFVETMKTKETVKTLMAETKRLAPELYEALVGERDLYMAEGLDRLDGNKFESVVAVMGMAHVDGVEGYLKTKGWREVKYPYCSLGRL